MMVTSKFHKSLFLLNLLLAVGGVHLSSTSNAQSQVGPFNYEGQLLDTSGLPVTNSVMIKTRILSPNSESCILYEGILSVTPNSSGYFSLQVGSSSMTRTDAGLYPFKQLFINKTPFNGLTCSTGSSFTPQAGDGRKLQVSVSGDAGATWDDLGIISLQAVAAASTARNLNGFEEQNFFRIDDGSGTPLPMAPITSAENTAFRALLNGTSNLYARSPANSGMLTEAEIPTLSSAGKVSGSAITSGTIGGSTAIATSGTISTSGNISTTGTLSSNTATFNSLGTTSLAIRNGANNVSLLAPAATYSMTLPSSFGTVGQVLGTDGAGNLVWQAVGGTGTVTNVNTGTGLTGGPIATTGTISLASSGVTPGSYGSTTTIPQISVDATGRITSAVNVTPSFAPTGAATGDLSGSYPAPAVAKLQGHSIAATAPSLGSFMKWNDSLIQWEPFVLPTCTGSNQVIHYYSISDIWSCDTLTIGSLGTVPQANGGTGSTDGSIYGLSSLDIMAGGWGQNVTITPSGNGNTILNGKVGIGTSTPTSSLHLVGSGSPELRLETNDGTPVRLALVHSGILKGSFEVSSFSTTLDTNSSNDLQLRSNGNTDQMVLSPSGMVGIGTSTPYTKLDVNGTLKIGDSYETCFTGTMGSLRFNGTQFELCDGTGPWKPLNANNGQMMVRSPSGNSSSLTVSISGYSPGDQSVLNLMTYSNSPSDVVGTGGKGWQFYAISDSAGGNANDLGLTFWDGSWNEAMYFTGSTNPFVGIGTTSPMAKLDVQSNAIGITTVSIKNNYPSDPSLQVGMNGTGIRNMGHCVVSIPTLTGTNTWSGNMSCPGVSSNNTAITCSPQPGTAVSAPITARYSGSTGQINLISTGSFNAGDTFNCMWMD